MPPPETTTPPPPRLLLGALLLLCVDLIWVLSSELSDHIYHDEHFDKPFFTVFVKTGMFMVFLLGRIGVVGSGSGGGIGNGSDYRLLTDTDESTSTQPTTAETIETHSSSTDTEEEEAVVSLTPSAFVPINYDDNTSDEGNGRVKFSRVAEVRHCSPQDATAATLSRMSYHASLAVQDSLLRNADKLTTRETARVALAFCAMWFLANYTYALAISTATSQVALINVLSSTSSLFTLGLSALFPSTPSDRVTISKLFCVLVSICGVIVVSFMTRENGVEVRLGAGWALVSAGFYAAYLVFLRRAVGGREGRMDVFLFFGFVGLFNVLLLWPVFLLLHYSSLEVFAFPTHRQWGFLLVNGILGTVFSEVLWVWSCLLTSSLIATLAITLTIPMSMIADVVFKGASYNYWFYVGSIPVLVGFVGVTLLGVGDWDPLGECRKEVVVEVEEGAEEATLLENEINS